MKKGLVFLLTVVVLVIAAIYLFIPNKLTVAREIVLNANSFGIYRSLADETTWNKWWPKDANGYEFTLKKKLFKTLEIGLKDKDSEYSTGIRFIPLEHDSSLVRWEVPIETGNNPIQKVRKYFEAKRIAKILANVLDSMRPFMEKEENLYMLSIKQSTVTDTAFVSTRVVFNHFPTTEEVYSMIDKLHKHVTKFNGKEAGHPMLNIDSSGKDYEVMVAIATEKLLPEEGDVKLKRMIQGNILIAEVTGGPNSIKKGMSQMHEYVRDHQRTAPAIPFQLLITDRSKEKDTSKWLTELHYPVF